MFLGRYLERNEVIHLRSVPRSTPQHNPWAEQAVRELKEDSGLGKGVVTSPAAAAVRLAASRRRVADSGPVWNNGSPCSLIAFQREVFGGSHEVWAVHEDPSLGGEFKLSLDAVDHGLPTWNPTDGLSIAYSKFDAVSGEYQIFTRSLTACPLH